MKVTAQFPQIVDYLDIIPAKPLSGNEKKVIESFRELAMKHRITFTTPKAGRLEVGEVITWAGAGERGGFSNVALMEVLKARTTRNPVVITDYEASFAPDQLRFMIGSETLDK